MSETQESNPAPQDSARPKRRRWWIWLLRLVAVVAILVGAGWIAILVLLDRTVTVPEWARKDIEQRIEASIAPLDIDIGDMNLIVHTGWRPRAEMQDVVLRDANGQVIARLGNAQATLAMRPLLRGQVQPKRITLGGAFMTLRRDREGSVSLQLGDASAPVGQARNVAALIDSIDGILQSGPLGALVDAELTEVVLRYEDYRAGQAWTVDGGRIGLNRTGNALEISGGFSLLSGRDYAAHLAANYQSVIGESEAEFGVTITDMDAHDIASQSAVLGWLGVLRAPVSGALRGSISGENGVGSLNATLQIGKGVVQPTDQTRPVPFDSARTYLRYDPADQLLSIDELLVQSPWVSGRAEGQAQLVGIENGQLRELVAQLDLSDLRLNPREFYETPLELSGVTGDVKMNFDPFTLNLGHLTIMDGERTARFDGSLRAEEDGWHAAVNGEVDQMTQVRLMELWPKALATKPRTWVENNLIGGFIRDVSFAMRLAPNTAPVIYGDFDYVDVGIKFLKFMPMITGAYGQATLIGNRFVTTATAGTIEADRGGSVNIAGTSFIIPDISLKESAPAIVRLDVRGAVTAMLDLLDREPISVLRATPFEADLTEGTLEALGTLSFPMQPQVSYEALQFHLAGQLRNIESTHLVPGHITRAKQLTLTLDQSKVEVHGNGSLSGVPASVAWHQPIGPGATSKVGTVTGRTEISNYAVEALGIGLPKNTVSGKGQGDYRIELRPGQSPSLRLTSDLRGVGMRFDPLSWRKGPGQKGMLDVAGTLGSQMRIDRLILQGAGLSLTGSVLNRPGGGLERALISSVRMGKWLDASVELIGQGNKAPSLRILGGKIDLRYAEFGDSDDDSGSSASGPIVVALNKLQITESIALTDFSGQFTTGKGLSGPFRGKVNGGTVVTGRVVPERGRSSFFISSDDAGGVLRSWGPITQVRGGKLSMSLRPPPPGQGDPGSYDGTLAVSDTRVKDAPVMAALLNAVSIIGLFDELSGKGIKFVAVNAKFRLGPNRLTLFKGTAEGPSIGLSMDGRYDMHTTKLDMQGTITPAYIINAVGAVISGKGEGLIGITYKLRGTSEEPRVQVNPISALTPSFLREIFHERKPTPEDELGQRKPTRPNRSGKAGGDR